jgi:hypothetical protein
VLHTHEVKSSGYYYALKAGLWSTQCCTITDVGQLEVDAPCLQYVPLNVQRVFLQAVRLEVLAGTIELYTTHSPIQVAVGVYSCELAAKLVGVTTCRSTNYRMYVRRSLVTTTLLHSTVQRVVICYATLSF